MKTKAPFVDFLLALLVVAMDRASKLWVVHHVPMFKRRQIIPSFFQITHTENSGAAFSLFADSASRWKEQALIAFSLAALAVLLYLLAQQKQAFSKGAIAISLIMGGAVGNLWDRIAHGRVVDFLLFYVGKYEWPVFNLADSCIVVGAILLAWSILWTTEAEKSSTN